MMLKRMSLAVLFAALASADQPLYGQCGGIGYTGSTLCVSGATCTSYNDYYYQCIPATGIATSSTTSVVATTTLSTTTASSTAKTSSTASVASSTSSAPTGSATQYLITFGDSYSQTGFEISGTPPSPQNPLGNPLFPGWTTAGGANWIGLLVSKYNVSSLLSYNLAYGGATTDAGLVAPYAPDVLSFVDQVAEFSGSIASHPSTAPWTSANSLFGVWMGVNDVGNIYYQSNATDIMNAIMVVYFEQLQILYDAGARNFVLLGVPPINESPLMLAQGAAAGAQEAAAITEYNNLLASGLKNFTSSHPGVTANLVDTIAPFQTAIDDPQAYGATDATCYDDDGTTCLWFNDYHPGMAIHGLVAEAVAAAWQGTFFT